MHRGQVSRFVEEIQASGRFVFTADELVSRGYAGEALEASLRRYAATGAITRIAPRSPTFLIVPPEHRWYGAPPVDWWLDDVMARQGRPYYLSLLSAAAEHGSSHFAVMETQVVTTKVMPPIRLGKIVVRFFQKAAAEATPIESRQKQWAPLKVSTPEATVIDILQFRPCGVARAAMILSDLSRRFRKPNLIEALDATAETTTAQRLGYLLQYRGADTLASIVEGWLSTRRTQPVDLEAGGGGAWAVDRRWLVKVNAKLEAAS